MFGGCAVGACAAAAHLAAGKFNSCLQKKQQKKNVADGATLVPPPDVAKALVIRKVVIGGHGGMSMWYLSTESFCMSRGSQV